MVLKLPKNAQMMMQSIKEFNLIERMSLFSGRACPDPGNPKDGRRFGDSFDVGKRIRFRCNPGYKMIGSRSATCLSTLQWNARTPKCQGWFLLQ